MDSTRRLSIILCLALLVTLCYANIAGNRFTNWDDEHLIVRNKGIRTLDVPFILKNFHLAYPPLTVFSHCLDFSFWRLNPVGYHISDLLIYILVVLSFYFVCENITRSRRAALIAAAIFAVHPLHVETVAWLSSRKDGLGTLFYLLAFLAYLRFAGDRRSRFLWLSALFYFLALWSKPLTATLPLALMLYDMLLAPRRPPARRILTTKLPYLIPVALTAAAAFFLDPHDEIGLSYHGGSAYRTFLMMLTVLADYLRMLILPVNLSAFYVVRVPERFTELPVLFSTALLLALLAGAAAAVRRRPFFSFCVFWAGVSLLPVTQLVPMNVVKADRYLYLPTAAFCLLCGAALSGSRRRWLAAAVAGVLTAFSILTIKMNTSWSDSISLWESVIARNPASADACNNLGIAYMRKGLTGKAEEVLKQALRLRPGFASAHNNLGNLYRLTGKYEAALRELEKAKGLTEDIVYSGQVYVSIGLVHEATGNHEKALAAFEKAMELNPVYLDDAALRKRVARYRKIRGEPVRGVKRGEKSMD